MAIRRSSTPSPARGSGRRSRTAPGNRQTSAKPTMAQAAQPGSRFGRTGWAFLVLAFAVVTALRE